MEMRNGTLIGVLAATHVAAFGAGYQIAPKPALSEEKTHTGPFTVDTTKVLETTVQSLREENKLLVFSYKGSARVQADRSFLWLFRGHQELIVPAIVNFYIDLSRLGMADAIYDERAKLVRVTLPPVIVGDIAFQPENATTINGGLLTFSEEQVEALRKLNYGAARRAMAAQAQQAELLHAAQRSAVSDIVAYFEIPLRIAGMPDVKVAATFK